MILPKKFSRSNCVLSHWRSSASQPTKLLHGNLQLRQCRVVSRRILSKISVVCLLLLFMRFVFTRITRNRAPHKLPIRINQIQRYGAIEKIVQVLISILCTFWLIITTLSQCLCCHDRVQYYCIHLKSQFVSHVSRAIHRAFNLARTL